MARLSPVRVKKQIEKSVSIKNVKCVQFNVKISLAGQRHCVFSRLRLRRTVARARARARAHARARARARARAHAHASI